MCHANFLHLVLLAFSAAWLVAVVLDPQPDRAAGRIDERPQRQICDSAAEGTSPPSLAASAVARPQGHLRGAIQQVES